MPRKQSSPEASSLAALYLGLNDNEMAEALRLDTAPADVRRLAASVLSQDETPQTPEPADIDLRDNVDPDANSGTTTAGLYRRPTEGD